MNETAALRGWTEAGFRTVILPTGSIVRLRLPALDHLLRRNVFPHELEGIVIRFTMENLQLKTLNPDELRDFLAMRDILIANAVKGRLVAGSGAKDDADNVWEDVDLLPYVAELDAVVPAEDLDKLGLVVMRFVTPEAVSAESRIRLGLTDALEKRRAEEEVGPSAGDFRGVRDEPDGAPSGQNGADVQLQPERSTESGAERGRTAAAGSGTRASDRSGTLPSPSGS